MSCHGQEKSHDMPESVVELHLGRCNLSQDSPLNSQSTPPGALNVVKNIISVTKSSLVVPAVGYREMSESAHITHTTP